MAGRFPNFRRRTSQRVAHVNIGTPASLFIFDAVLVPGACGESAGNKQLLQFIEVRTHDDYRLRRRVAVASLPKRVDSADHRRQTVLRAVKIDGSGLAVIAGDDAQWSAVLGPQRITNLPDGLQQFWPAA